MTSVLGKRQYNCGNGYNRDCDDGLSYGTRVGIVSNKYVEVGRSLLRTWLELVAAHPQRESTLRLLWSLKCYAFILQISSRNEKEESKVLEKELVAAQHKPIEPPSHLYRPSPFPPLFLRVSVL